MASEELKHAQEFMKIQRQRGGSLVLKEIPPPKKQEWSSGESGVKGSCMGGLVTGNVLDPFS